MTRLQIDLGPWNVHTICLSLISPMLCWRIQDAVARDMLNKCRRMIKDIPADRCHARNLLSWFADLKAVRRRRSIQARGRR